MIIFPIIFYAYLLSLVHAVYVNVKRQGITPGAIIVLMGIVVIGALGAIFFKLTL